MKTPREFLFERHKAADPRLDEIRKDVVDRLGAPRRSLVLTLWEELVLPARRAWMGLGAVWVIVLALNWMAGGDASIHSAAYSPINPDSIIALQRQEVLMAQQIRNDEDASPPAATPKQTPRSETRVEYKIL